MELKRSEERLRIALETADLHVIEIDYVAKVVTSIGAPSAVFAAAPDFEALRANPWGGIHPRDRRAARRAWQRHMTEAAPFHKEVRVRDAAGEWVWALLSAELIRNPEGRPQRLVAALQDLSELRQAEGAARDAAAAAEAANAAKSAFLATMSHEIRTPLNGVLGMAQAMAGGEMSPVQRERLQVIQDSGEALLAILNDVLDLSKIEAGRLDLESISFDLGELVRGAQAAFTTLANKKGLSFALEIAAAEGVYLGDPTRVRQILYNLISNALKFTLSGEIRVTGTYESGEL